ncbi:MAG: serine/threonine-protein kinase [Cyanobacteriota bacterium]|nr:serine/threonine-protein kinase [Cyanobacteriota bacterium]
MSSETRTSDRFPLPTRRSLLILKIPLLEAEKIVLQTEQLLQERYRLHQQLGNYAGRQTWLAQDLSLSPPSSVIVKLLAFNPQMQWDEFKLFEREAQVLKSLEFPYIPRCRDSFSIDADRGEGLCWFALVQEYIPGKSLQQLLDEGHRFSKKQVRSVAVQILEILRDLQSLNPPILHRDIKPSNLILGTDKKVYLIDFGAVCDATKVEGATFTVVGTAGYAPLEQFWGKAVPASDLYALGATLIHLLTGVPPSELPQQNLRIQFRDKVSLESRFLRWIERLTEPDLSDRFSSAAQALAALETGSDLPKLSKPARSRIWLRKSPHRLSIKVGQRPRSLKSKVILFATLIGKFILSLGSRIFVVLPFLVGMGVTFTAATGVLSGKLLTYALLIPSILIPLLGWFRKQYRIEIQNMLSDLHQLAEREIGYSSIIFYGYPPHADYRGLVYNYKLMLFLESPLRLWGFSIGRAQKRFVSDIRSIEEIPGEGIIIEVEPEPWEKEGFMIDSKKYVIGQHLSEIENQWVVQEIKGWIDEFTQTHATENGENENY